LWSSEGVTGQSDIETAAPSRRIADSLNEPMHMIAGRCVSRSAPALRAATQDPTRTKSSVTQMLRCTKRNALARPHAVADVEIVARAHGHHVLGQQLPTALNGEQLRLHYQPLLALAATGSLALRRSFAGT
jgi:hypothetical protein